MTANQRAVGLVVIVLVCFVAAGVGVLAMKRGLVEWYPSLAKPSWTPPNWVFGPVWTFLYLTMGVAAWLVWRRAGWAAAAIPLTLFAAQLALNALWTPLFFGLHRPDLAFADIVVLWLAIVAATVAFWRVTPSAAILMLPYLAWVSFASALNFAIWRMNA
jgi:tryptophan-rich sensory protein